MYQRSHLVKCRLYPADEVRVNRTSGWLLLSTFILSSTMALTSPFTAYFVEIVLFFILGSLLWWRAGRLSIPAMLSGTFFSAFVFILTFIQSSYLEHAEIIWPMALRFSFWVIISCGAYAAIRRHDLGAISRAVAAVLVVHVLFFYIEFFLFRIFSYEIDYSLLLWGTESRKAFSSSAGEVLRRTSGLTSEPAIYAGYMLGLIVLRFILIKKNDILMYIALSSLVASQSTLGVLLCMLYLFFSYARKPSHFVYGASAFALIFGLVKNSLIARYELFVSGVDGSNEAKLEVWRYFFSNPEIFSLGYGFIGVSSTSPRFYEGLYDNTVYLNFFSLFGAFLGLFALLIFLLYLFRLNLSVSERLLVGLAFVKISSPVMPFFIVFVVLISAISWRTLNESGVHNNGAGTWRGGDAGVCASE